MSTNSRRPLFPSTDEAVTETLTGGPQREEKSKMEETVMRVYEGKARMFVSTRDLLKEIVDRLEARAQAIRTIFPNSAIVDGGVCYGGLSKTVCAWSSA